MASRFFAPAVGVPEDPVTGSAHCALAPHWAPRVGRDPPVCHRASPRGGVLRVRFRGGRVLVGGEAITVLAGRLAVSPGPVERLAALRGSSGVKVVFA